MVADYGYQIGLLARHKKFEYGLICKINEYSGKLKVQSPFTDIDIDIDIDIDGSYNSTYFTIGYLIN